ncbi:MAPEG family protein [Brevundimonas sp.]|uniref:MAPEG family protein n=1 Tax=Brevundimonas sp. TaxID=1871086 RepID=UPI001E19B59E|nr:MAPEG family protein [Brevundimonas sp.]MBA3999659.1 glutathione S-transferase [Brevundimonas sp.]
MDLFTAAVQDSARAAALWGGLLILLLITLSGLVVRQRQRLRIGYGDGEAPELMAASRAFGNAAEYAPAGMAALALMAMVGVTPWLMHAVGAVFFLGRLIHAFGLSRSVGATRSRVVGMMLTYIPLLTIGVILIAYAVP